MAHHPLVDDYLARLRAACADLPLADWDELLSGITEHISTSMAELDAPSDEDVRAMLARLGEPEAIAAEARQAPAPAPVRPGVLEWAGLLMLGLGSIFLVYAGTVIGLITIAFSKWWSTRQKLVAAAISLTGAVVSWKFVIIYGLAGPVVATIILAVQLRRRVTSR